MTPAPAPPETASAHPRPYADAPRLPEGERVDVHALVRGAWLELEIGPGRGGFLFERAAAAPECALVGLELRRKWAAVVDERLARQGLARRARVFAEDARFALPRLSPDGCLRRVFVHFPDPWWKKRHQKRLVVSGALLDAIVRLLEPGGELFLQTDVVDRAEQYRALLASDARFEPGGDAPGEPSLVDNPYGARSPRERRAARDGLAVYRMRFVKRR
jgi:tRNA (guanine-N7-)-methyltransferase